MKKLLIILMVVLSVNAEATNFQPTETIPSDTTVLTQILALPLSSYIGKPVDSLFSVLPMNYTYRGFMPERVGFNRGVIQTYGNSGVNTVTIQVYIDNYQFMNFPNYDRTTSPWDMNLAKKETISFIKIIKNNKECLHGCNDPNYSY